MSSSAADSAPRLAGPSKGWQLQQVMLRIKDPKVSLPFYTDLLGFRHVDTIKFDDFTLYFLESGHIAAADAEVPAPGTDEAHTRLWNVNHTVLELTHNHGTEDKADFAYNNGNVEPHRGFGHIAVSTDDVYASSDELERRGASFQKKPSEGRMKGLAFVKDPDGYWVEVISRPPTALTAGKGFSLAQCMLRVKDPVASVRFYTEHFGMSLVNELHFPGAKFSLYFLASLPPGTEMPLLGTDEAQRFANGSAGCVLELTHNHGTESDPDFSYHSGNTEPRGFGHIGFTYDGDLADACAALEAKGVKFQKRLTDGRMKTIAFALDPDGYWVELIPRNLKI